MKKFYAYLMIVITLGYTKIYNYAKDILEETYFNIDIYLFFLIPLIGLVFGFLLNFFNQEFQIKRKINLIYLSMSAIFLLIYYYPFIPYNLNFLGGILNLGMSPIRSYVIPILSGFYLSKGLFINKSFYKEKCKI